jgi:lysophospholipase L1-like esterase
MKKEWFLIICSVSLTLFIALILVRWFAPQLLGLPVDLQMVRVAKKVPPFFDGVFRSEDYKSEGYLIQDPYIMRAKPLLPGYLRMGPNDILGFRNRNVSNIADIVTIGDSQTYGNNVTLEENWPNILVKNLSSFSPVLYNMSVGGWGAAEYFEIFNKALYFQPKVIIVAFYTGNDAIDTFNKVYGDKRWDSLRLNKKLTSSDAPTLLKSNEWKVHFHDGLEATFTPTRRYLSNNRNNAAVKAGYEIMGQLAQKMGKIAAAKKIGLVYTIIPTKELAFKRKIYQENMLPRKDYLALVNDEERNLMEFAEKLKKIPGAVYIDLLDPIQQAIAESRVLYPFITSDGHPVSEGYKLIGEILSKEVSSLLPAKLQGGVIAQISITDDSYWPLLIKNGYFYRIASQKIAEDNGWTQENIKVADLRDINKLPFGGVIETVNPSLYGPAAFGM